MTVIIQPFVSVSEQVCNIGRHEWSIVRLIELSRDFPVMEVPIKHLYIWQDSGKCSLRDMLMHIRAALDADLSYPIILDEDGVLMDGRHRIIRALFNGAETIKAVRFESNPRPCRINGD
jgi:hypothetical protein